MTFPPLSRHPVVFWTAVALIFVASVSVYLFYTLAKGPILAHPRMLEPGLRSKMENALKNTKDLISKRKEVRQTVLAARELEILAKAKPQQVLQRKAKTPEVEPPLPRLDGIVIIKDLNGGEKHYAILNGKRFEKGMQVGGYRLKEIGEFSVLLEGPKGVKELYVSRYPLPGRAPTGASEKPAKQPLKEKST